MIHAGGAAAKLQAAGGVRSLAFDLTTPLQLSSGEAFYPQQCMTRQESLLSYTLWAAHAGFQEQHIGSVEVGKRADLVLWDTNLLECPPPQILTAKVLTTVLAGRVVYSLGQ